MTINPDVISVDVLDDTHTKRAEITDFNSLELAANAVTGGRFILDTPDTNAARTLRDTNGSEVAVYDNGRQIFGGPVLSWDTNSDAGTITHRFEGINWLGMLGWRWTDPEPATASPPYSTNAYDEYADQVSDIIAQMVDKRCGTAALAGRQFLTVNTPTPSGPTINYRARLRQTLGEAVAELAIAYGYTMSVTLTATGLEFDVTAAATRPNAVVGPEVTGLDAYQAGGRAPEADTVLAGGQGELVGRTFSLRTRTVPNRWPWRIEQYVEHTEIGNAADLAEAADRHLEEWAEQSTFTADLAALRTDTVRFGRDYQLGDYIPLRIAGVEQTVRVMSFVLNVTDQIERSITVGIPRPRDIAYAIRQATGADRTARRLRGA